MTEDLDRLKAFHSRLNLTDIRCVEFDARLSGDAPVPPTRARVHFDAPRFYVGEHDSRFAGWFQGSLEFFSETERVAAITVGFIVDSQMTGDERPDDDTISEYLSSNSFFLAFPYIREAFHSAAARIGMPPVVLGPFSRDESMPEEIFVGTALEDEDALT